MKATHKARARTAASPTVTHAPTSKSKATEALPDSARPKQDRVTLIAFYALFGAVALGLLYFISLILFI